MGLESMSEPDDLDLEDEEGGGVGDGVEVEVDAEGEADVNENDDEPFFDTQSVHSIQGRGSRGGRSGNKSEDGLRLDLGRSLSLWIGLNPELPSRG